ncbi:MAG: adenylosuccinate synthase [Chloroflexota bacterium]|nr:adenylosuccinate synthase [Chloroflexota bacterium]
MTVVALIGGQWGEEGKGKFTELLSENAKVVVRYSGGGNVRQPVVNSSGRFTLQYIPRSIFNVKTISVLGAGMIVDPQKLVEELDALAEAGIDVSRLYISEQTHVIMPYHPILEEQERRAYGTPPIDLLAAGLGPAYADKISRVGIRIADLLQEELFLSRLSKTLAVKNDILTKVFNQEPLSLHKIYHQYLAYGRQLRERIFDTRLILQHAIASGGNHRVLLESDQGSMLDLDFGTYPYVSNVAPTVGAASSGSGIPPSAISGAVGVFSSYISRVQIGPFPTEMTKEESLPLTRFRGHPSGNGYSAPLVYESIRRYGWFDAVAARFVVQLNGLTSIGLTHLDGMDGYETLKICTHYQVHDTTLSRYPSDLANLRAAQPIYEEMPGWKTSTSKIRRYEDLPPQCQYYIQRINALTGVRVEIISTGTSKEDTIMLRDPFNIAPSSRLVALP